MARPICFSWFWAWVRAAASRTFWTAGSSRPMRMAMMAITTSSSISVNPRRSCDDLDMDEPPIYKGVTGRRREAVSMCIGTAITVLHKTTLQVPSINRFGAIARTLQTHFTGSYSAIVNVASTVTVRRQIAMSDVVLYASTRDQNMTKHADAGEH